MFLPVGDAPNPRFTPWVNWSLMAANVVVFVLLWPLSFQRADPGDPQTREYLQTIVDERPEAAAHLRELAASLSRRDVFVFEHGFRPGAPRALELLGSMFLHGGLMHLLGNMLFLWIFGDNVEHRLGRFPYLLFYLGTGVAAGLGDGLLRWGSGIPAVGASGAISGVLGAYFLWFPKNRVRTWILLFPIYWDVIEIGARFVLGFYVIVQNLLPLLLSGGSGGGVSYGAHLGGFIAGLAVAFLLDRLVLERPEREALGVPSVAGSAPGTAPAAAGETFRAALAAGRVSEAVALLVELPRRTIREELVPRDLLGLGLALERAGHGHAALAVHERLVHAHPGAPELPSAHLAMARLLLERFDLPTEAYQHLRVALERATSAAEIAEGRALWEELTRRSVTLPRRV